MRSGFTIIRNGERLAFPYRESILSLAPFVDEVVVAVGNSDDGTRGALEELAPRLNGKLRLIDSPWDPGSLKGGFELSRQTNLALDACRFDVCFYLQADELLLDTETETLHADLSRFEADDDADALLLRWRHFFGTYSHVVESKRWYRREIRVLKKSRGLRSYGDAQGFRIPVGDHWRKARGALARAHVHHYGWVRPPEKMLEKTESLDRLWHGNARDGQHREEHLYPLQFGLQPYTGPHPAVMKERIRNLGDFNPFTGQAWRPNGRDLRLWLTDIIERATGWRPGEFKNYSSLKQY